MKYFAILITGVVVLCGGLAREAGAQLGSRPAEEWRKTLDQPDRIAGLKTDQVIARLALKPGQVIADLGAGTGVFSVPMAKAVAPGGKVYAVEVDKGYFGVITDRTKEAHVTNVQTILGEFGDPKLPAADVDVAFFHDVLHHIDDRAGYLKNVARYVKPAGRIVVIDLKPEQSPHKDQPNLVVSEEQVTSWMAAAGFNKVEKTDLFAEKYFLVYAR